MRLCQVALPLHLDRVFDYRVPKDTLLPLGVRVRVPFGRRETTGIVVGHAQQSEWPQEKLRLISTALDAAPLFSSELLQLADWLSRYYHHPLGEVLATMLPAALRNGQAARLSQQWQWRLTASGVALDCASLHRAPRQQDALRALREAPKSNTDLLAVGVRPAVMARLATRGWVERVAVDQVVSKTTAQPGPPLSPTQTHAVSAIVASLGAFDCHLLDGVTGSGKTEVYLQVLRNVIDDDRQGLLIVPEIALTPLLMQRVAERLGARLGVLHSGLADGARAAVWLRAQAGELDVVVGTRSAIFTPFARLGMIVVDEEHDSSFKQQDGLRYSARDVAVQRAHRLKIPVVLGSATPSLESLGNVAAGRYRHLQLPVRAGGASMPAVESIDLRNQRCAGGLSERMIAMLEQTLANDEQAILFLNRRGYAPTLMCNACGWYGECERCDARFTLHRKERRLRCHHCGSERRIPDLCPQCASSRLEPLGTGTERLEQVLGQRLPGYRVLRLDRDVTRSKNALEEIFERVHTGDPCVLVGTQMLAKGHDFPNVTLVGIVDMDQTLFSSDFRAAERAAQLLVQVSGRAGRGKRPGRVVLQTRHPGHALFNSVLSRGYAAYAQELLTERRAAGLPPHGYIALLRAEAKQLGAVRTFLDSAIRRLPKQVELHAYGPIPAPMEKRAGFRRQQVLLLGVRRTALQKALTSWVPQLYTLKAANRVRWSLDVDPQDMF